ncbi:MAG: WYL domain-containing protein [Pseudomonadota bacterium]|nr:WYL domain-containing protein [Pseudomonadota bacterium]
MSTETSIRLIHMLRFIPKFPAKRSLQNFRDNFLNLGFDVSNRTIQRDLVKLSRYFPLICDDRSLPHGWSWMKDAKDSDLAAMDKIEALSLSLAQKFLENLMPINEYERISNLFDRANNILEASETGQLRRWRDRVRVISSSQKLISPEINQEVKMAIYNAVLHGKQIAVKYLKANNEHAEERVVNPLGIVLQGIVNRVVCTMDPDFTIIRHLPLHRFKQVTDNGKKSSEPKDFDMDDYIAEQNFGFPRTQDTIDIEIVFNAAAGFHLSETPLSENQKMYNEKSDKLRLLATVADTEQLRWWLLSFGENVEVIKPASLRDEFKERVKLLSSLYD